MSLAGTLTVVNHLDIVARPCLTDPITARLAIDLSGSLLEYFLDGRPGGGRSSGHERRTIASTLFTTGYTGANEKKTFRFQLCGAADRIRVMGVSAVDDDIAFTKERNQLIDENIDCCTSLDKKDDFTRGLKFGDQLLGRMSTLDVGSCDKK